MEVDDEYAKLCSLTFKYYDECAGVEHERFLRWFDQFKKVAREAAKRGRNFVVLEGTSDTDFAKLVAKEMRARKFGCSVCVDAMMVTWATTGKEYEVYVSTPKDNKS